MTVLVCTFCDKIMYFACEICMRLCTGNIYLLSCEFHYKLRAGCDEKCTMMYFVQSIVRNCMLLT